MTLAELVKTVLDVAVGNYPTYGIKPPVKITGYDRKDTKKASKGIDLINIDEDPVYTTNGVRMPGNQYCEMIINETTFDRVANLYNDIETLLQASSYDLTLSRINLGDKVKVFERKYRIRYYGGKV
jgi:hypothetical protein